VIIEIIHLVGGAGLHLCRGRIVLVLMHLVDDVGPSELRWCREHAPVPAAECTFHENHVVCIGRTDRLVQAVVDGPYRIRVRCAYRFIDKVVAGDCGVAVVVAGDLPPHPGGVALLAAICPVGVLIDATGVAVNTLSADDAMHVDHDIQSARCGIGDEPVEHGKCIGAPSGVGRIIDRVELAPPDRNAHDVEAGIFDVVEIGRCHPALLVGFDQALFCRYTKAAVESLDHAVCIGETAAIQWRHPLFHDEPAAEVESLEVNYLAGRIDDISAAGVQHA